MEGQTDVHGAEGRTAPRLFLATESGDLDMEGKLHFNSLHAHPGATGALAPIIFISCLTGTKPQLKTNAQLTKQKRKTVDDKKT